MEDTSVRLNRARYHCIMQTISPNLAILLTGLLVTSRVALAVRGKPSKLSLSNATDENSVQHSHVTVENASKEIKMCSLMHQYRLRNDIRATVFVPC